MVVMAQGLIQLAEEIKRRFRDGPRAGPAAVHRHSNAQPQAPLVPQCLTSVPHACPCVTLAHPAAVHVCRSRSNPPPLQLYQCTLILIPVDFLQLYNMAIRGSDWKTSPATNVLVQVWCSAVGYGGAMWAWGLGGGRLHRSLAAMD